MRAMADNYLANRHCHLVHLVANIIELGGQLGVLSGQLGVTLGSAYNSPALPTLPALQLSTYPSS